jgi:tetratricopeptide (TPR) repeat protein
MPEMVKASLTVRASLEGRSGSAIALGCRRAMVAIVLLWAASPSRGAEKDPQSVAEEARIAGVVVDAATRPVADASVRLAQGPDQGSAIAVTKTDSGGNFFLLLPRAGTYSISAEKSGLRSEVTQVSVPGDRTGIHLVLETSARSKAQAAGAAMEFADQPNFTVAGVTDWTAVGGHGSDAVLRTSEELARDTATLARGSSEGNESSKTPHRSEAELRRAVAVNPDNFETNHELGEMYLRSGRYKEAVSALEAAYRSEPSNYGNERDLIAAYRESGAFAQAREHLRRLLAHQETAELHRLAGEVAEKAGDPLEAVGEFATAARLDPSEESYFAWGSELLVHRAVWQAMEVFQKGSKAYPKSARMQAASGAALFAGARYDEAALRLCAASDLNPKDAEPYLFLGKIAMVAPTPLACVEQKLARFSQMEPDSAVANYLYAMVILKGPESSDAGKADQAEGLLRRAVALDPKCADGWLQLGILAASRHDMQKAIGLYSKAIEASAESGEAHYRLGVAYDRLGDSARAKEEFRLHDEIEKRDAESVERERHEIKQFLVVLQGQPASGATAR